MLLPAPIGDQAQARSKHIDGAITAEAKGPGHGGHGFGPEAGTEIKEIGIRRPVKGLAKIDDALPAAIACGPAPVPILTALSRELVIARILQAALPVRDPLRERRQGHEGFKGGTRRVLPAHGTVEKGLVLVLLQCFVAFGVEAPDEIVGVVGRGGSERQDAPAAGIERNHGAPTPPKGRHRCGLEVPIKM